MLWLSKHARFRNNLSPYIDGRLPASQATALKAHLASCETCRRELEELRATTTALNELPQAEAPRSFAITPEMLKRKAAAVARPTPALGVGMRLAGAAVAVALAVILVGDLTLGNNGASSGEAGSQPAEQSRMSAVTSDMDTSRSAESGAYAAPSGTEGPSVPPANVAGAAPCTSGAIAPAIDGSAAGAGGAGTAAGRGGGETPATTATPQPAPSSTPTEPPISAPDIAAICRDASGGVVAPVAPTTASPSAADTRLGAAGNAATTPAASESNENGGISTFRVAEIVLAAILVAILAGVVLEAALRRRRIA